MKKYLVFLMLPIVLGGFSIKKSQPQPRNIILLIGDGMGISQMSAAFYFKDGKPNFTRFPVTGLVSTSSCEEKITDSAAGATAYSTGKKTSNGRIAQDESGQDLETLVEYFSKKNWASGLIATSSITHATPASFFAHEKSRNNEKDIASQLAASGVDFFAGGGKKFFGYDELKNLRDQGFELYFDSLKKPSAKAQKAGFLLAEDGMPPMYEGRGDFLTQATELALRFFEDDKEDHFFLMVEGSQIDWGGHANNANYVITEVIDFDEAVGAALDFAEKDGNTLMIVTADHETGGFTLAAEEKKVPFQGMQRDYNSIRATFSTGGHSAALVPVLAYGPGAEMFTGIYPNTEIHTKILSLTGK